MGKVSPTLGVKERTSAAELVFFFFCLFFIKTVNNKTTAQNTSVFMVVFYV